MDFFRMLRNAVRTSDLEADDENDHDSLNQSESSSNMSSNTHIPGMKTKLIHQKRHALNTTYFKIAFGKGTVIKKKPLSFHHSHLSSLFLHSYGLFRCGSHFWSHRAPPRWRIYRCGRGRRSCSPCPICCDLRQLRK